MESLPRIKDLTYRCQHCGFLCVRKKRVSYNSDQWGVGRGETKRGNYGNNATPEPVTFDDSAAAYTATTISFSAATDSTPAKINDSQNNLADKSFLPGMKVAVSTTSGTNDGVYTLAERGGVSMSALSLSSSDSLTDEDAAVAGEVSLTIRSYQPNITTGCPLCGSLNSR